MDLKNIKKIPKKVLITLGIIILIIIIALVSIQIKNHIEMNKRSYTIENIELKDYKYFITNVDSKVGVIDNTGKQIIEPIFDNIVIPNPTKDVFICMYNYDVYTKNYDMKIINSNSEELFKSYDKVEPILIRGISSSLPYEKSVLKFMSEDKYGLIDFDGNVIVGAVYDELDSLKYKEGEFIVKQNDKYGVINNKGYTMISCMYDSIEGDKYYSTVNKYKNAGYIVGLKKDDAINFLYGYINNKGKQILDVQYLELSRFVDIQDEKNAYLLIKTNNKYTLYKNGNLLADVEYDKIQYNKDSKVFIITIGDESGVVDEKGNLVVPVKYKDIELQKEYVKVTDQQNDVMYYNLSGNPINNEKKDNIIGTSNSKYVITVDKNNKYGVMNENGDSIIENKYDYLEYLFGDYFIAKNLNSKLGIIDNNDETVIKFEYDSIGKINDTNALVAKKLDEKVYDIYSDSLEQLGSNDKVNISNIYINNNKYIEIYMSGNTIYINDKGEKVDTSLIYPNNELFVKNIDGKYGYVDKNGDKKVEAIYDEATEFNVFGFAGIKINNKWGVINEKGEIIVEPKYEFDDGQRPDFIDKYVKGYYGYGQIYYTK